MTIIHSRVVNVTHFIETMGIHINGCVWKITCMRYVHERLYSHRDLEVLLDREGPGESSRSLSVKSDTNRRFRRCSCVVNKLNVHRLTRGKDRNYET